MRRTLIVIAAFGILGAAAVAHGLRTDRWGTPADLQAASAKLQELPKTVGDWTSKDVHISDQEIKIAQVAGYLARVYEHKYTHETATIMILCGRPGPVAVHSPEICYAGAGFVPGPATVETPLPEIGLWKADFRKTTTVDETLRIRWGWSTNGTLIASNSPRIEFSRSKMLFKLYLIRSNPGTAPDSKAPELDLLKELQPYLQQCLTP